VLSIITGGGKWVELTIYADPLYQHLLLTAEKKFWGCVLSGETPRLFGVEPPRPRLEAVRIVDMSASNSWAEFAATLRAAQSIISAANKFAFNRYCQLRRYSGCRGAIFNCKYNGSLLTRLS
jgi:hypothetical protein